MNDPIPVKYVGSEYNLFIPSLYWAENLRMGYP